MESREESFNNEKAVTVESLFMSLHNCSSMPVTFDNMLEQNAQVTKYSMTKA